MKEAMLVLEETYIDPYVIANSSPDENIEAQSDSLEIKDIGGRFMNAIQSLSTPQEVSQTSTPKSPPSPVIATKKIHIIAGSFSELKNAKALTAQLKKRGFLQTSIIKKNNNGLIRVAIDSFYTEEEAHLVLEEVKKQLSSAWVLNTEK
jgi:cell division protein FtsN